MYRSKPGRSSHMFYYEWVDSHPLSLKQRTDQRQDETSMHRFHLPVILKMVWFLKTVPNGEAEPSRIERSSI